MSHLEPSKPKSIGTVLVIGGCGFLGSATIDQLLNFPSESTPLPAVSPLGIAYPTLKSRYPNYDPAGTSVHALDLKCTRNLYEGCTYHEADITSTDQLLTVFRKVKPDVVINTASPSWEAPPAILRKVNIDGTRTLIEVAGGKHGDWGGRCKIFVHTSSSSVISDAQSDLKNADERWPYVCPNPREYYSETKVHAEKIALQANDQDELGHMLTCAVRPAGIIGEGDLGGFSYGILKTASVAPGWQLHLQLGEGSNLFDNTYVHNVVYGHLCAVDALLETAKRKKGGLAGVLDTERVDGEAFIVTNDEPGYFWDTTRFLYGAYGRNIDKNQVWALPEAFASLVGGMSELVGTVTGRKGKLNRQTVKYACISRYYSCAKLKKRTGYVPLVGIEEGLVRSAVWFKDWEKRQSERKGQ